MRLYLDDNIAGVLLLRLLAQARHDVQRPADVGLSGVSDPRHFTHAVREDRLCLTRNHRDFEELHELVQAVGGHHPGLLLVRFDNDPTRDLRPHEIVRAIAKLEASGAPIRDGCHILNHWR
jgi:hypothetical protein